MVEELNRKIEAEKKKIAKKEIILRFLLEELERFTEE